jgi:hypothetical protein
LSRKIRPLVQSSGTATLQQAVLAMGLFYEPISLFKGLAVKSRRALSELARRLRADRAPEIPLTFILAWFGAKVSSAAHP